MQTEHISPPVPGHRLDRLTADRLAGMRRGLEKESLRTLPNGMLALTPHPQELGSPLTHPHVTTDFSESQLELVTGTHASAQACLDELVHIHQEVYRVMALHGDERLWVASMPCGLPTDETIPLGRYGNSNVGRAKSVYRMGLGHRYGRRMQTISGIHYNWSMPGLDSDDYFALIRNFRRHSFVLLYLFGASPAVCSTFVEGRAHGLQPFGQGGTMHLPWATSLRMGRLGYQSDAQAALNVSYNSLEGYAASLHEALTRPYPAYETVGIRNPGGDYNQLATSLLQIENEFYGTIRPKRVIRPGERPLHALRERGVEYIEVRLMDLNPFLDVGIDADTMRFLDMYLLYCLLQESPADTPAELEQLKHNQQLTASRGREPGLRLLRGKGDVLLTEWAAEVLEQIAPLAAHMDALQDGSDKYRHALAVAMQRLAAPGTLPSARVLAAMQARADHSFVGFVRERSAEARRHLLALPCSAEMQARFARMAHDSLREQKQIEKEDTLPFEEYRQHYVSPDRLMP